MTSLYSNILSITTAQRGGYYHVYYFDGNGDPTELANSDPSYWLNDLPLLITYDSKLDAFWYISQTSDYLFTKIDLTTGLEYEVYLHSTEEVTGIEYDPNNEVIWAVTKKDVGTLLKIDPVTMNILASYTIGYSPIDLAYDATNDVVWCLCNDRIRKVDVQTEVITGVGSFGSTPQRIVFDSTNNAAWITSCAANKKLYRYNHDNTTLVADAEYSLSTNSDSTFGTGICFDPTQNSVWVIKSATKISKILATDGSVIDYTIPTGTHVDIKYDISVNSIWISNDSSVSCISASTGVLRFQRNTQTVNGRLAIAVYTIVDISGYVYNCDPGNASDKTQYLAKDGTEVTMRYVTEMGDRDYGTITTTTTNGIYTFENQWLGLAVLNFNVSGPKYTVAEVHYPLTSLPKADITIDPLISTLTKADITGTAYANSGIIDKVDDDSKIEVQIGNASAVEVLTTGGEYILENQELVTEDIITVYFGPGIYNRRVTQTVVNPNFDVVLDIHSLSYGVISIAGTAYSALNTPVPTGTTLQLFINSVFVATTLTEASGIYTFSNVNVQTDDVIDVAFDGLAYNGCTTVTISNYSNKTGVNITSFHTGNSGTWSFDVLGVALSYQNGIPNIKNVAVYNSALSHITIGHSGSSFYLYDSVNNLLTLPSICSNYPDAVVTYIADNSCSYSFDGTHYNLCTYTTKNIAHSGSEGLFYSYPKKNDSSWRSLSDINLNPALTGISEGFIFISDEYNTPARANTTTYPDNNSIYYVGDGPYIFSTVSIIAQVVDAKDNYVSGETVTWSYKIDSGAITPIGSDSGDHQLEFTTITNIGGFVSLSVGDHFLNEKGLTPGHTITFYLYHGATKLAEIGPLAPIEINPNTAGSYIHTVVTKTENLYTISSWVETSVDGAWKRKTTGGSINFFKVDKNGITTQITDKNNNTSADLSVTFPYIATIDEIDLTGSTLVYAKYGDIRSNTVKL